MAPQIFAIGATAKLGATVVTYPLLLVKSRLMSTTSATEAAMRYRGTWDALCRIYNEDGAQRHPSPTLDSCVGLLYTLPKIEEIQPLAVH
jgi:hypothetical protein